AQGEHKILRGFEPVITHSCHWIAHPAFRAAIDEFVTAEAREINAYAQEAAELLPYRREARAME
ncbi:peptidogalycan biosysnthesis protein, partial [Klebsiella pneumoniae]|uniref:peptidogalycan biosysnthesis protein n=1 Tax=Klebsiella pneumoniae TaxID=573 RepID=UPI003B5AA3BF